MLGIEEVIGELNGEEKRGLPPGFRFHPTDEELIAFYLASKVFQPTPYSALHMAELDLNRCEPWLLPDEAKMGEREWYFFSLRMRKYPTGLRTNRATAAGYWKATGKDRQIYSASTAAKLGTKKTLVFYRGGAPRGHKTSWVLHEFRLHSDFLRRNPSKDYCMQDEWVLCRIIQKIREKIRPQSSLQEQPRLFEAATLSPPPISLPPLPETPPTLSLESRPSLTTDFPAIHHENNLQSLILNPPFTFQSNLFPVSSFSLDSPAIIDDNISPPMNDRLFLPSSSSCSTLLIDSLYSHWIQEEMTNVPSHQASTVVDGTAGELMDEIQANAFQASSIACQGFGY